MRFWELYTSFIRTHGRHRFFHLPEFQFRWDIDTTCRAETTDINVNIHHFSLSIYLFLKCKKWIKYFSISTKRLTLKLTVLKKDKLIFFWNLFIRIEEKYTEPLTTVWRRTIMVPKSLTKGVKICDVSLFIHPVLRVPRCPRFVKAGRIFEQKDWWTLGQINFSLIRFVASHRNCGGLRHMTAIENKYIESEIRTKDNGSNGGQWRFIGELMKCLHSSE